MHDRSILLDQACMAMAGGDPAACQRALDRFSASVTRQPLSEHEQDACADQMQRLRMLAEAATQGVGAARDWLRQVAQDLASLDVYDQKGRQRVATGISTAAKRF